MSLSARCAARARGLEPERVEIHTTFLGGGFGRRANPASDFVVEAVEIAKATGVPFQLVWTREDEVRGGYYRRYWLSRARVAIDASDAITGWMHTLVGQSFTVGTPFEPFIVPRTPPHPDEPLVFEGRSSGELCRQLRDPEHNGGKSPEELLAHVRGDPLVAWGWDPGEGREPVSTPHRELVRAMQAWVDSGCACPDEPAAHGSGASRAPR